MNLNPDQSHMLVAQELLQRTTLKGSEVDAYAQCYNLLEDIKNGVRTLVITKDYETLLNAYQVALKDMEQMDKQIQTLMPDDASPELEDVPFEGV